MKKVLILVPASLIIFTTLLIYSHTFFQSSETKLRLNKDVQAFPYPDSPDKFELLHYQLRNREKEIPGRSYKRNYQIEELKKLRKSSFVSRRKYSTLDWKERGPGNVPGRTRGLLVIDSDPERNTWFAGSASGGIWKTTNAGQSWDLKTPNIPNLSTTVLAKSESSNNILYAGTGEFFNSVGGVDGNGLFKSVDGGETWLQLASTVTNSDFRNTFGIIVDPSNPDIVIAAVSETSSRLFSPDLRCSIYKSSDGGTTWTQQHLANRRIQDIEFHKNDFTIQYASVDATGVLKSVDSGETWTLFGNEMSATGRIELTIAPTDANRLYAAVQGSVSGAFGPANPTGGNGSDLYVSYNAGENWELLIEQNNGVNHNFFDGQGGYNNTIVVHPFDEDIIYVGGVDLWKMEVGTPKSEIPSVGNVDTTNVGFINFINFSASFLGGRLETGNNNQGTFLSTEDFVDVEIRFGPGLEQMGHRFSIQPGSGANGEDGSGVPPTGYLYQDYVEVPFQAWDMTNNRQLMVSFRDQEDDGAWDLVERSTDDQTIGREYFFINGVEYNPNEANVNIAKNAGHSYKQLYFMWPSLSSGFAFDPENLPEAKIAISKAVLPTRNRETVNISDSRAQYDGKNASTQSFGEQIQTELHPDHHNLLAIPVDNTAKTFKILNSNDGGVFVSNIDVLPGVNDGDWTFSGTGYNTSQFYGIDKRPGKHEYVGGMQDNGSWRSPTDEEASASTNFLRQITGDGFEAVWHYGDENLIIGSSQGNSFRKSINGGLSWNFANAGYSEASSPFVSKLEGSKNNPDVLFTVGGSGVWRSQDFAGEWESIPITDNWVDFGFVMDVKTSISNHNIVWAGGGMTSTSTLHVSTDGGGSFKSVSNFEPIDLLGRISGIETHPTEDSTAFVLFSFASGPKVIKTTNLGKDWQEISGFGDGLESVNGFPNVAVNTLLVMPYDTSIIWVGTEVGIVESLDGGNNWHFLDSNFPSVSVWELKIVDDQVIAATHGRGIWSVEVPEINLTPFVTSYNEIKGIPPLLSVNVRNAYDSLDLFIDDEFTIRIKNPTLGINEIEIPLQEDGTHKFTAYSYMSNSSYKSSSVTLQVKLEEVTSFEYDEEIVDLNIFPNPIQPGIQFNVGFSKKNLVTPGDFRVVIFELGGKRVDTKVETRKQGFLVKSPDEKGMYVLTLFDGSRLLESKRIIVD